MRTITLSDESKVEAFTDCYAEIHGTVILLSIIGNDSVVKAISGSTFWVIRRRSRGDIYVNDATRSCPVGDISTAILVPHSKSLRQNSCRESVTN